jgi:3-oxoacyl-[acyl-carrier protein] reductase
MFGLVTWRKATAYQTSKFGLIGFSAALRAEYQREHFGVTALCPGFVRTSLVEGHQADDQGGERAPPAWLCTTPAIVAAKAMQAIHKNRGMVLITPAAHFYWRLMRISPALVDWLIREGWRRRGRIAV